MIWSSRAMPIASPAWVNCLVAARSCREGSQSPDGWLCARTTPEALSRIAGRNTSRGWQNAASALPMLTVWTPMARPRASTVMATRCSCERSRSGASIGKTWCGDEIARPSRFATTTLSERVRVTVMAFALLVECPAQVGLLPLRIGDHGRNVLHEEALLAVEEMRELPVLLVRQRRQKRLERLLFLQEEAYRVLREQLVIIWGVHGRCLRISSTRMSHM